MDLPALLISIVLLMLGLLISLELSVALGESELPLAPSELDYALFDNGSLIIQSIKNTCMFSVTPDRLFC